MPPTPELARPVLHLLKVPGDREGALAALLALSRRLTGRDPTAEELARARATLGLPPAPPA